MHLSSHAPLQVIKSTFWERAPCQACCTERSLACGHLSTPWGGGMPAKVLKQILQRSPGQNDALNRTNERRSLWGNELTLTHSSQRRGSIKHGRPLIQITASLKQMWVCLPVFDCAFSGLQSQSLLVLRGCKRDNCRLLRRKFVDNLALSVTKSEISHQLGAPGGFCFFNFSKNFFSHSAHSALK